MHAILNESQHCAHLMNKADHTVSAGESAPGFLCPNLGLLISEWLLIN